MSIPKNKLPKHEFDLLDNSIERVISTTISILKQIEPIVTSSHLAEDIEVNLDDWNNLKETVTHYWNEARNEVFKKHNT